jgi:hypothetical protein
MAVTGPDRLQALQQRIDRALREPVEKAGTSRFSEYAPIGAAEVEAELMNAARHGGIEGVEAVLDRAEALAHQEDASRLRYALSIVLTHLPGVAELGLRLPSLQERAIWKVAPSKPSP